jgi:thiol-disulfide isomerase/thioredoxin
MKPKLQLLLLFSIIALSAGAQNDASAKSKVAQNDTSLKSTDVQKGSSAKVDSVKNDSSVMRNMGDSAPQLRVRDWIKGTPVTNFEKGKLYVVEFWATWCGPCIAAMPHLSALARKYKGKVTFSAVSVWEDRGTKGATPEKLKAFVDGMGDKMDFNVASEDTGSTVRDWLKAFHQDFIPVSFVVDGQERVAWTGNTKYLDTALTRIVNNSWDLEGESSRRKYADSSQNYLDTLDYSLIAKTHRYQGKYNNTNDLGFPDSTLMVVDEMVKKEPKLKYASWVVSYTFNALLITDPHKACEFGKQVMVLSHNGWSTCGSIIGGIRDGLRKLPMPKEIYLLGAECYQAKIDQTPPYYTAGGMAEQYHNMADWYRLGGDKLKALAAEKKAIKLWEKEAK